MGDAEGKSNFLIPGAIIVAGAVIALAIVYVNGGLGVRPAPSPERPPTGNGTPVPPSQVSADDDPILGDPNAPVTMIEFSDFQCPFCARFWGQTLTQIKEKYIKTGKVKFVYRDFPISSIHSEAEKAAEAAECADEQGKFWEYHDLIFARQDSMSIANYKRWAAELKLDTASFNSCLDSGKYTEEVAKDFSDGQAAGVSGTPTFFINGRSVVGALPFEQFKTVLDKVLAGE